MNFKELRQKYPQYGDMSDEQFAQSFHKKFYSDIPYEDFSKRIGLEATQVEQPKAPPKNDFMSYLESVPPGVRALAAGPVGILATQSGKAMEAFGPEQAYKAGGAVTDIATKAGAGPGVSAGLGYATNVGVQAIPTVMGAGLGKAAGSVIQAGGERLMQSALKPSLDALKSGKAETAIKTMLGEGINVTKGGVEKLQRLIEATNSKIVAAISTSPATVDKGGVVKRAMRAADKFRMQVNNASDLKAVYVGIDEFLSNPVVAGLPNKIKVQLAQELKQGTYRALGSKAYGELSGASIEVQKQLARGLKEQIAKAAPGVDKLNKAESALLDAHSLALTRVLVNSNKDPVGLGWLVTNPAAVLGWAADRSPLVKSLLARGLHTSGGAASTGVGASIGGAVGAIEGQ